MTTVRMRVTCVDAVMSHLDQFPTRMVCFGAIFAWYEFIDASGRKEAGFCNGRSFD
jgi:hypothetical protein